MKQTQEHNFWVVARPAEDVKGQWVAHCLDLDVVTQGTSAQHSLEMVAEAVAMVAVDDVEAGRNPLARRAPKEFWDEMYQALNSASPVSIDQITDASKGCVIAQMTLQIFAIGEVSPRQSRQASDPLAGNRGPRAPWCGNRIGMPGFIGLSFAWAPSYWEKVRLRLVGFRSGGFWRRRR